MNSGKIKKIYKTIMLIIVVALITFVTTTAFLYNKLGTSSYANLNIKGISSELIKKLYAVRTILNEKYISEMSEEDLINGAIKGYVEGIGDKYTEYFTKEEMEDFETETEGNYVGIGIYMYLNTEANTVEVLYPIEDSPAEKVGILTGDIIKKIDGVEYTGEDFEEIAKYIKGKEGTKVKIEVERNGKTLEFEVERKTVDLYPIKSEVLDKNVGYIKISSFDSGCAKEFKETFNELNKNELTGLIIDVRNNGGGIVEETLEIADYALERNDIILITKDKQGNKEIEKSTKKPIIQIPIVILTNEASASASEILVAALKDNGKATVVGEKTYGKGVIQELLTLSDGSGIKITTEEYYTPNENKINKIGIEPDEKVSLPKEVISSYNLERKYDTQLQKAIEILKK